MSDSKAVAAPRAITVPFHGADLCVIEHNGQPYTPMKPIVTAMGLDWGSQFRKVASNKQRWGITIMVTPLQGVSQSETPSAATIVETTMVGSADGKSRALTCIPVRKVAAWLTTIEPGKVKSPEVRARVIQYQNECDDVLWQYWNDGIAVNPRAAYSVNPGDVLTKEEADALRQMVEGMAKRLTSDTNAQGKFIRQAWSKLKSHFHVSYRQIPRQELTEAISIINRHTVDWELVDDEPPPEPTSYLRATVKRVGRTQAGDWAMYVVSGECGFGVHVAKKAMRSGGVKPGDLIRLEYLKKDNPLSGPFTRVILWDEYRAPAQISNLLPEAQAKEIIERLDRLCLLFHPLSTPFDDAMGVMRALRGQHPVLGSREVGYRMVLPPIGQDRGGPQQLVGVAA